MSDETASAVAPQSSDPGGPLSEQEDLVEKIREDLARVRSLRAEYELQVSDLIRQENDLFFQLGRAQAPAAPGD